MSATRAEKATFTGTDMLLTVYTVLYIAIKSRPTSDPGPAQREPQITAEGDVRPRIEEPTLREAEPEAPVEPRATAPPRLFASPKP